MTWEVGALELSDHLIDRMEYHTKRNKELIEESKKVNDELERELDEQNTVSDRMAFKSTSNYRENTNRRDQLINSARNHAVKATVFKFYHDHVPNDPKFRLSREELVSLEFIPQVY
jgi:hypothetical protein